MTIVDEVCYLLPSLLKAVVSQSQHFFDMMARVVKGTIFDVCIRKSVVASPAGGLGERFATMTKPPLDLNELAAYGDSCWAIVRSMDIGRLEFGASFGEWLGVALSVETFNTRR